MEWTQFAIFFIGVFGIWLWQRSEHRTDWRQAQAQQVDVQAQIRAVVELVNQIRLDNQEFKTQWALENKDFHHRLLEIEKSRK